MTARVLVVDDDPGVLGWMVRVLVQAGYEVFPAARVRQARIARGPFAALVLDIGLPNGGPHDVQLAHPGVPTITISGDPAREPDLRKPFFSGDLLAAVESLIGAVWLPQHMERRARARRVSDLRDRPSGDMILGPGEP